MLIPPVLGWRVGGVDYTELNVDLHLVPDDRRRCVEIVILADDMAEEDETFEVIVEELEISTTVTILADGRKHYYDI